MVYAISFPSTPSAIVCSLSESPSSSSCHSSVLLCILLRRSLVSLLFVTAIALLYRSTLLALPSPSTAASSSSIVSSPYSASVSSSPLVNLSFPPPDIITPKDKEYNLEKVLKDAATDDNTVIITTMNEAWTASGSIMDLFLESFRIGDHTRRLLNHVVIVALDPKALRRCIRSHPHCFALVTEGIDFSEEAYFMTPDYLKMMWRRIEFLQTVLEMGYNFVFTDADILWFRNPFPRFHPDTDFQVACDQYSGNPVDVHNRPNGGFNYVKSNNRSIEFYRLWHSSRKKYPRKHDQDVLNLIKSDRRIKDIGLSMRFLDTAFFGGFCEPSRNFNHVCTMHANCCYGMKSKVHDLKIMIQDWRGYMSMPPILKRSSMKTWRVPMNCSVHSRHKFPPKLKRKSSPSRNRKVNHRQKINAPSLKINAPSQKISPRVGNNTDRF